MNYRDLTMQLTGGFRLRRGSRRIDLPRSLHRVLSLLALYEQPLQRCHAACTLWPDSDDEKAQANLRTAIWRLRRITGDVLAATAVEIGLNPTVRVDVRTLHDAAREYRRTGALPDPLMLLEIRGDLLPGWSEDWLQFERERVRQEAVQLLESSARQHLSGGEAHLAMMLSLAAVECDPLRESGNLLVVEAYFAVGDPVGATRHSRRYTQLLADDLGVPQPQALTELLWPNRRAYQLLSREPPPAA